MKNNIEFLKYDFAETYLKWNKHKTLKPFQAFPSIITTTTKATATISTTNTNNKIRTFYRLFVMAIEREATAPCIYICIGIYGIFIDTSHPHTHTCILTPPHSNIGHTKIYIIICACSLSYVKYMRFIRYLLINVEKTKKKKTKIKKKQIYTYVYLYWICDMY